MKKKDSEGCNGTYKAPFDPAELRLRARNLLDAGKIVPAAAAPEEYHSLVQELQTHQIELELQNQSLQQAHLEAEQARWKYFNLYDLAPVGYATFDPRGEILEINLTGARLLNQDRRFLVNRRFQLFLEQQDIPAFNRFLQEVFVSENRRTCEVALAEEGETRKELRIDGVRIASGPDQETRCQAALLDVTEQKRAEVDRRELARQRFLAGKMESLLVLAGGMAHDFNNLLGGILGNLELALLEPPEVSRRANLEEAERAARRAAELIRQMLAYTGQGVFPASELDLTALVSNLEPRFRADIKKNVRFHLELKADQARFRANPEQVELTIRNLLANAQEAVGDLPGTVTLSAGRKGFDQASLSRSRLEEKPPAGEFVYLEVSDSGPGMSPEAEEKMFDPFFSTKFTGRGLGLAAVYGISRAARGAILVDNRPGIGTTVRILFPAI